MGDYFNLTVEMGVGWAEVELLGPCESKVVVTGRKGTPPKKLGQPFALSTVTAKIGVGAQSTFHDDATGHDFDFWTQTAQLTMSDAGVAWYEIAGEHDRLDLTEEPEGSDRYVLSKGGEFMGRVTLTGVTLDGPG